MLEYLLLLASLFRTVLCSRIDLVAENLLLCQQHTVLTRPTRKRLRLRSPDRLFWVVLRALHRDWRQHLVLVRPDTVVRWHRQGRKLFWRRRSHGWLGRPQLSAEVRELRHGSNLLDTLNSRDSIRLAPQRHRPIPEVSSSSTHELNHA